MGDGRAMNIALLGRDFAWGGGSDFLRMVANALKTRDGKDGVRVFLLLPDTPPLALIRSRLGAAKRYVLGTAGVRGCGHAGRTDAKAKLRDSLGDLASSLEVVHHYNTERGLLSCLRKIKADVVMPVLAPLGESFPVPWVGYIYDFQHKYYPGYFSEEFHLHRDASFAKTLKGSSAVIINSRAVRDDILKFFPDCGCEPFNLPFAPAPSEDWFAPPRPGLGGKYGLPDRYFLVSSQFWIHKSHATAFEALSILHRSGMWRDVHVVCTGNTDDCRFPGYFGELKDKVAGLGLADKIHFLGHIPKIDQINIMKGSVAVIQPTLFEGGPGGGSVYDAISLGVPAIVSDIPVNREIEDGDVVYFKAGSADELAEKMGEVLAAAPARPSREELLEKGLARTERLGDRLLEAADFAIRNHVRNNAPLG